MQMTLRIYEHLHSHETVHDTMHMKDTTVLEHYLPKLASNDAKVEDEHN